MPVVELAIALLILKSALELAAETIRTFGEEEVDLSRFEFGTAAQYEQFRSTQLRDWMLYQVEDRGINSRSELTDRVYQAIAFNNIAAARAMGFEQQRSTS